MEQSTEHPKSVTKNGYSGLHSAEAPAVKDVINAVEDSNIPRRKILTKEDLDEFQKSKTFEELVGFIKKLNESVVGQKNPAEGELISKRITRLVSMLEKIKQINERVKPVDSKTRFGNVAFKEFYDGVGKEAAQLLEGMVPQDKIEEVGKYLRESFGNRKRIDYGTGHELNFVSFLCILDKIQPFEGDGEYKQLVLCVFYKYIEVMRALQASYWLEPAGSHGVWGLDDYHFLPFLFGSAQLRTHKHLRPKSIHSQEIVQAFAKDYMYFECIRFICSVKTGSLRWHSPMLDDISGVKTWEKVNSGLIKMYLAEVLGKLPIMQHFLFGSLLPFQGGSMSADLAAQVDQDVGDDCKTGHVYALGQEFPVCCGIRIPSAFSAVDSSSDTLAKAILPFD